jgi:hypothetical protein
MLWKADRITALALALGLATLSPALLHALAAADPGGVRGTVTTTADEPVPAATIDVVLPNDSASVGSAVTAADGRFRAVRSVRWRTPDTSCRRVRGSACGSRRTRTAAISMA